MIGENEGVDSVLLPMKMGFLMNSEVIYTLVFDRDHKCVLKP